MQLPNGFVLGAATAAYQIEGAVNEDGRGVSIWDTYSHTPGRILDGQTGDIADDHYHRLDEDLDLMARLGLDAYRFSIAWPRIVPQGTGATNAAGIDFYSRLVDGLLARGIRPMATLYHWDLPQPLEDRGGWANRDTATAFAEYAAVAGAALGDRVDSWATLNEPWGSAYLGYASGAHAPGRQNKVEAFRAVHHLNLAHGLATQELRGVVDAQAQLSVVLNVHSFRGVGPTGDEAREKLEAVANDAFLAPMFEGRLSERLLAMTEHITDWGFVEDGDLETICQPLDLLGLNFYHSSPVRMRQTPDTGAALPQHTQWPGAEDVEFLPKAGPLTEMGWNIDPAALTELLLGLTERFPGLPLMITENGLVLSDVAVDGAVQDAARINFIRDHLKATMAAIDQGADVRGYLVWSLLDNFEWSFGFSKRFGLVHVDYETQTRTLKDSARWFSDVISRRQVDE